MHRYIKGARSERELLNRFYDRGWSVLRSAGSGVNSLGPDIVAVKDRYMLAFECKAWEKNRLSIDPDAYKKLHEWQENTRFPTYIAWRMNGKGWFFVTLDELKHGNKDHSITKKKTLEINRLFEDILAKKQDIEEQDRGIDIERIIQSNQVVLTPVEDSEATVA